MITCMYVMWSSREKLAKVGIAGSPHARMSQLRREKSDDTIKLMACWNILALGDLATPEQFEVVIVQRAFEQAGFSSVRQTYFGEWFSVAWPTAVEMVEQCAQLAAPLGVRLRRMPGSHGE